MRREGIFKGKEEAHKVCNGGLVKELWWVDREGNVEVAWEGINESCG